MAQEITFAARLKVAKGNIKEDWNISNLLADMAGTHISDNIQSVPTTTAGALVVITASVATPRWGIFQNNDAINYIELGLQVGGVFYPFAKLLPNEVALLPIGGTIYARANTAAADLAAKIVES